MSPLPRLCMLRGIAACADLGARADALLAVLRAEVFAFAFGIRYSLPLFHRVEHPPYFHH
jgi:hypothetical protein